MRIFLTHQSKVCTPDKTLIEDHIYPQQVHMVPGTYDRVKTGLFTPYQTLTEKVMTKEIVDKVRDSRPGKTAFILAAGNGNFAAEGRILGRDNFMRYQYRILPLTLTQIFCGRMASMFGEIDYSHTDATACTSSLKVMMDVQTLIKFYGFKRVIVLAVEDQINNMTLQFFGEAKASLTEEIKAAEGVEPSAFDEKNFGFYIGHGAALAVFDAEDVVRDKPIAELISAYTANEAMSNAIGQREDGQGFVRAIKGAMEINKIDPKCIRIVKTHGTGTRSNNQAERAALLDTLPEFVATSYKQRIGHTMGASGLLETLLLLEDMDNGFIPPILNRTEDDAVFLSKRVDAPDGLILSLSAGMGNVFSAAIFDRGH